MFEVLAFVYENYWGGDACPELPTLQRKLTAVGFDSQQVLDALVWLEDLKAATNGQGNSTATSAITRAATPTAQPVLTKRVTSMRVFTPAEQERLGDRGWALMIFLDSLGALHGTMLELVLDRVMATPGQPVSLEDLKLIVLMVYWSLGHEPDALLLDELCDHRSVRLAS